MIKKKCPLIYDLDLNLNLSGSLHLKDIKLCLSKLFNLIDLEIKYDNFNSVLTIKNNSIKNSFHISSNDKFKENLFLNYKNLKDQFTYYSKVRARASKLFEKINNKFNLKKQKNIYLFGNGQLFSYGNFIL